MGDLSNNNGIIKAYFVIIVASVVAWSCDGIFREKDYEIKSVEVAPSEALPLAFGTLSIEDVLSSKDNEYIKVASDGVVYLSYDQVLKSRAVGELVVIPDVNGGPYDLAVPPAIYPPIPSDIDSTKVTKSIAFDKDDQQLTEILLKSGTLFCDIVMSPNNPNFKYAVRVDIPEFTTVGTNAPLSITTAGVGKSFPLNTYLFKSAVANTIKPKLTLILKQNSNSVTIPSGTKITATVSFKNLDYKYVKGFLGKLDPPLPEETLSIQAFGTSLTKGATVSFVKPKIEFKAVNEIGVPTTIEFKALEARKPGSSLLVAISPASPVSLDPPSVMGESTTKLVEVSNVNDLLNFAPTQFYYKATAHINEGSPSITNFLTDTSKLKIYMHVEVPLYGHASNIILGDTLDYDLTDADQSQITSAALKIKTTNEIPIAANVQFYLTTDKYVVLDSLLAPENTTIIKGSQVNASGELVSPGVVDQLVTISKDKLNKLFQARKVIIKARMNTTKDSNGNYPDVKFKSTYKMNIKLGLQVNGKIKIDL